MKKKKKIIISGTGCALADFLYTGVRFNNPQFRKYLSKQAGDGGLSPGKLVFTEELEKFSGEKYTAILKEITGNQAPAGFNIGGPGLVTLIHASQLLERSDFEVRFYGGMGNDKTADLITGALENKIPLKLVNYSRISTKPTPFTDVLSDETYDDFHGERTFINNIGAAWDFSPDLLDEEFFSSDIVCFGGTALVPQIHDNLTSLLQKAKKSRCITVVNTVFDFRNEKKNPGKPWPLCSKPEDFQLIDLLIMDGEEAMKLSGSKTIDRAADFFIERKVPSFIITNGAGDIYAFSNGRLFKREAFCRVPVSEKILEDLSENPALKGDTTGCGDNFAGGAIASLARQLPDNEPGNLDFRQMLAWAVASGGFACFYLGGTYFEKAPYEKRSRLEMYKNEYIKQISRR